MQPHYTISSIKRRIEDGLGVPLKEQNILFGGRHLKDDQTLQYYQIIEGCTIHCYWHSSDSFRLGYQNYSYISNPPNSFEERKPSLIPSFFGDRRVIDSGPLTYSDYDPYKGFLSKRHTSDIQPTPSKHKPIPKLSSLSARPGKRSRS